MCNRLVWFGSVCLGGLDSLLESGDGGSSGGGAGKEEEALAEDEDEEEEEEEEEVEVRSVSPANSCSSFSSLYASTDKFYSDAESDDDYKDPLPETHQPSQRLQVRHNHCPFSARVCVCVCARACVCVCEGARARVCVCAAAFIHSIPFIGPWVA